MGEFNSTHRVGYAEKTVTDIGKVPRNKERGVKKKEQIASRQIFPIQCARQLNFSSESHDDDETEPDLKTTTLLSRLP